VRGDGSTAETALALGEAFADLTDMRKVSISGGDAVGWLDRLLSADLSDIAPGRAKRALLLCDAGGIRSDITVTVPGGTVVLLQDPLQSHVQDALAPHLGGDVEMEDRSDDLALFAFPGRAPPDTPGTALSTPSCLGVGVDLFAMAREHDTLSRSLGTVLRPVSPIELEAWRIASGRPRVGVDILPGDRPADAGLLDAVDRAKSSFLGQEALAEHPSSDRPRVLPLSAPGALAVGDPVRCYGDTVGEITSAATLDGKTFAIARIDPRAVGEELTGTDDTVLVPRDAAGDGSP
jgi:glycine cleavage system aminomethyltransferase T